VPFICSVSILSPAARDLLAACATKSKCVIRRNIQAKKNGKVKKNVIQTETILIGIIDITPLL
jgi:hypothetical protein